MEKNIFPCNNYSYFTEKTQFQLPFEVPLAIFLTAFNIMGK